MCVASRRIPGPFGILLQIEWCVFPPSSRAGVKDIYMP